MAQQQVVIQGTMMGGPAEVQVQVRLLMNIIVTDVITSLRFIAVLKQHIMNVPFSSGSAEHECGD